MTSYLDDFKNTDNFDVRKTEHVDFRYCKKNEYIDIKYIEAQYIEKYFESDTTKSVKTVKAVKFSDWLLRQNDNKNNIDIITIFNQLQKENNINMDTMKRISEEKYIPYDVSSDKSNDISISPNWGDSFEFPDQLKIDYLIVKVGKNKHLSYFVHSRIAIRYLGDISRWFKGIIEAVFESYITGELTSNGEKVYIMTPNNTITYYDNMNESYIDIDLPSFPKEKIEIKKEMGYLYFIKEIIPYKNDLYLYKVGFSNNPDSRFKSHQCSNPRKLIMYNYICCNEYKKAEQYMHKYFSNRKAPLGGGTEWFLLTDAEVDKICDIA